MFSSQVYSSWHETQYEKYDKIVNKVGFFSGKILDIGAGPGYLKDFLDSKKIDADVISLDLGKPADVIGCGEELPFKDNSFDAVISIDSMHLIKRDDFVRVLKSSGFALLALFFSEENREERRSLLTGKVGMLEMVMEFEIDGKENEYVILARKNESVAPVK